jgi:hypothetical protein
LRRYNKDGKVEPGELRRLMFGDFMIPGADPKVYGEITEYEKLFSVVTEYLAVRPGLYSCRPPRHKVPFHTRHVRCTCVV